MFPRIFNICVAHEPTIFSLAPWRFERKWPSPCRAFGFSMASWRLGCLFHALDADIGLLGLQHLAMLNTIYTFTNMLYYYTIVLILILIILIYDIHDIHNYLHMSIHGLYWLIIYIMNYYTLRLWYTYIIHIYIYRDTYTILSRC
jgi:hypothetical protein